ncbi:nucleotidyltransferase family protein (plasmid) [Natrinema zhouii]|uniref:nucleotidyltransferase family protein n=1 Tax=Natrinema zhouii TaxID=1710539 RepID=UPI001D001587|nr:nucleotidyltransferase family protein [Natrinema zhouii]UHQ98439.1 nucleotidyltransferase family protein [Natrinema zhouii]
MSTVVGVLLAAGTGSRFEDGNKLLARFEDEAIVSHAARTLATAPLEHTIGIVGHDADRVRPVVSEFVDDTIDNDDYSHGQSRSVRLGARAARESDADAALFLPGDMPCVDPATVRAVVDGYSDGSEGIVAPTDGDRRGNPVLFDVRHFDSLTSVSGDTGGRALFESGDVRLVPVDDSGIATDVDTVADLRRLRHSGCD